MAQVMMLYLGMVAVVAALLAIIANYYPGV
jgi:hypothetical protein